MTSGGRITALTLADYAAEAYSRMGDSSPLTWQDFVLLAEEAELRGALYEGAVYYALAASLALPDSERGRDLLEQSSTLLQGSGEARANGKRRGAADAVLGQ